MLLAAGVAVARVLGLAFSLVLARALTPQDYGFIQYSITLAGVIAIGTQPFAQHVLARFISANRQSEAQLADTLNAIWVILSILSVGTLLVAVPLLAAFNQVNLGALVIFAGTTIFYTYYGLARGFLDNARLLAAYLGSNLVQLIAIVLVVNVLGSRATLPALLIYGLSYLLPLVLLQVFFPFPVGFRLSLPRRETITTLLRFSTPVWISHACYILYTGIDVLLLEHFRGDHAVGIYSLSKTLTAVFTFVPIGITTILMPRIAAVPKDAHMRLLKYAIMWNLAANGALLIVYAVVYNWVVVRMFGREYVVGPEVFVVVALANITFSFHSIISSVMVGSNRPKLETISLIIALAGSALIGWIFIPIYGLPAAALTTLSGAVIALMAYGVIVIVLRRQEKEQRYAGG
jgi:O-antigen/teichoic acid export membrane protein